MARGYCIGFSSLTIMGLLRIKLYLLLSLMILSSLSSSLLEFDCESPSSPLL